MDSKVQNLRNGIVRRNARLGQPDSILPISPSLQRQLGQELWRYGHFLTGSHTGGGGPKHQRATEEADEVVLLGCSSPRPVPRNA